MYQEKVSAKNTDRPELKKLLGSLRIGDQVVVWKLKCPWPLVCPIRQRLLYHD
ncbi:recombinase family protein [Pedobacter sp. UYP1]|uniref:recombinase family protein n=1 Tax=Pedobacter sp. UYP1 TaxID=1756396 RepID=UPI003399C846